MSPLWLCSHTLQFSISLFLVTHFIITLNKSNRSLLFKNIFIKPTRSSSHQANPLLILPDFCPFRLPVSSVLHCTVIHVSLGPEIWPVPLKLNYICSQRRENENYVELLFSSVRLAKIPRFDSIVVVKAVRSPSPASLVGEATPWRGVWQYLTIALICTYLKWRRYEVIHWTICNSKKLIIT